MYCSGGRTAVQQYCATVQQSSGGVTAVLQYCVNVQQSSGGVTVVLQYCVNVQQSSGGGTAVLQCSSLMQGCVILHVVTDSIYDTSDLVSDRDFDEVR